MALERQRMRLIDRLMNTDQKLATGLANLRLPWYTIRNAAEDEETTEVFIYEEIGFWGITADDFVQDLNKIKSKNINLRINSPGGGVFDAVAIYNALVSHSAKVRTQVDALAASAASVIAMAGDEVVMMVGAQLMIHDAIGIEMGNARDMREMATFLDKQSDNIALIYAARGGGDPADYRSLMLKETWMFAQEAVDLGLADTVYTKAAGEDEEKEPPTPKPDEEGEEKPEDEGEEETDDDEPESVDDILEGIMTMQHNTAKYGFKYKSRNAAPKPNTRCTQKNMVEDILSELERI